jgi:simple sugar transport system ATP-binding protein
MAPPAAVPPRLRVEGLTKRFGAVAANDGVTLEVAPGELHALLGENGAGKSTLSACLYGLYRPDAGRILVDGWPVALRSPAEAIAAGIGLVQQHFVLVPGFTVRENITVGTAGSGLGARAAARQRIAGLARRLGLALDPEARVADLSVGEQQWVEILKAVYLGARLLILDEPTASLTPQESERLFAVIRSMTEEGIAVLLISHKLAEVMQADRVTILRRGRSEATLVPARSSPGALARLMVGRDVELRPPRPAGVPGAPMLEVEALWVERARGVPALRGVGFTVRRGEILGLAGVAGNGQSELFETLVGVRRPLRGSIRLDGRPIAGRRPAEILAAGVGHAPEDRFALGLVPDFSVAENLALGRQRSRDFARLGFLDRGRLRRFAEARVRDFAIATPSVAAPVRTLSGGNAQKVILARELAQSRDCLLLNQPTRGLDVGVVEQLYRLLLEKRREGYAILLCSEELDDLLALADRIAVIFRGEIMAVLEAAAADRTRLGLLMAGQA